MNTTLEDTVARFERAWRAGDRPAVADYLPPAGPDRGPLLVELAHVELELRLKAGEPATADDTLTRFPELAADPAVAADLRAAEAEWRGKVAASTAAEGDAATDGVSAGSGYELLGEVGRGGMGVVVRARQRSLDRPVALKFLPPAWAADPTWLARFRREARTASGLNHPNVCTVYDCGAIDGRPYISMEWVEGQTLDAFVGRVGVPDAVRLVEQVAQALAAAHAAGVVHRDIKPQNVMTRPDGIVKVLDFGLARPVAAATGTDPGTRVGTLLYMSPEQARAEPVDTATDVFALGVVAYELLTGRHPFAAAGGDIVHAIVTLPAVPAATLNPAVPAALDALIGRMTAKDARLRPTAAEVVAALADLPADIPPVEAASRSPSVGRERELADLREAFAAAAAGRGSFVCVTGEPGLGKTTLVDDAVAAFGRPARIARGHCSERLAGTEAYLPVLDALDHLLHGPDGPAVAPALRLLAPAWHGQLTPAADAPPDVSQERRKREFAAFAAEAGRAAPLVLVLDDVHWADPSSVDLLAYLGARCRDWRLLAVVTYRPADLARGRHPFGPLKLDLQGRGVCREVALGFLTPADVARYVEAAFPGHRFPALFAAVVHARTGGNPLFLTELLHFLRDRGVVAADGGGWALTRPLHEVAGELPASIRGLIERQLGQLAEADRALLAAGSVQGLEFDAAVVARVLGLEPDDVEERVDALARAHALVRLVGERDLPDGTPTVRYRFVHVLYHNALYATLRPTRRAAWSAAAAAAIQHHHGDAGGAVATELALLFEAGRDPGRAAEQFAAAARNAARLFAHGETAALAERGLGLLARTPAGPDRDRRELAVLLLLGVAQVATRGFAAAEVERTYERARALCRGPADTAALFPSLYGLWNVALLRGDLDRCDTLAAAMFELARGTADPAVVLQAHNALQQPLTHRGAFAAAWRHQERALALYDPAAHRGLAATYGEDPGVGCRMYAAVTAWCLGFPDRAARLAAEARALAAALGNPFDVARSLYFGGVVRLFRREPERVRELADELAAVSRDHGFSLHLAGAAILRGWSEAARGELAAGIAAMRHGLADWHATGAVSHRPYHLSVLAEALARAGRPAEGLACLDDALAVAAATGEQFLTAELHRVRAEVLAATDPEAAVASVRAAIDLARRQGAAGLELRAATSRVRLSHGDEAAVAALAAVYATFTEGFDTADLRAAGRAGVPPSGGLRSAPKTA